MEFCYQESMTAVSDECCSYFSVWLTKVSSGILISSVMQKVIGYRCVPKKLFSATQNFDSDHQYFHVARYESYGIHGGAGEYGSKKKI